VLYQFHEIQRSILSPLSHWAKSASQLYTNPYSPLSYAPGARRIAATLELTHRIGKKYEKPEWRIEEVQTPAGPASVTPVLVADKPFCNLIHFEKSLAHQSAPAGPKLLIVAPLSGHHATLLRDTVRVMLEHHDVYITDWVDARMVPIEDGTFSLTSYVGYVQEFIRMLSPDLHLISVCQPTVPVLGAVSLMASQGDPAYPLTMTMMGGPIDTRVGETGVNDLAKQRDIGWFRRNVVHLVPSNFPGFMRRVYPGFLQHAGFIAMNPGRHANSHWDYFQHLVKGGEDESVEAHREFYDEYNAVLDLDASFYLDTIEVVFQDHLLPRGLWDVNGQRVKPATIQKTALLTIEGELDDISGPGQTEAAHALCTGIPNAHRRHETIEGAGHYGIFSGRRWRSMVAPKIAAFIAEYEPSPASSTQKRSARRPG